MNSDAFEVDRKNLKRSRGDDIFDLKKNNSKRIRIYYECPINNPKRPTSPKNTRNTRRNNSKKPKKDEDSKDDEHNNSNNNSNKNNTRENSNLNNDFLNLINILLSDSPKVDTPTEPVDECKNPLCNHKTFEEDPSSVEIANITKINNIEDLIKLGKTYHCKKNKEYYGLNLRILCNLVLPLTELQNMVGLKSVKNNIVDQILFFLRGYNKKNRCNECIDCSYNLPCARNLDDMLHTVITGPPGVGKTHLGKILCKIYKESGILSKGHFTVVTRSDLVAKYLGQTAIKTQQVINKCLGGVMFIDEAYALGHSAGRDSFSKECLDTLNQNLSEKRDFLCIIAGYKDALDKCFFSMNEGLSRRFAFRYNIEGYNYNELMEIFLLKISQESWKIDIPDNNKLLNFFKEHQKSFPNYGGDIETLFLNCKIAHCRKISIKNEPIKDEKLKDSSYNDRILSLEDIYDGFQTYLASRQTSSHREKSPPLYMYN